MNSHPKMSIGELHDLGFRSKILKGTPLKTSTQRQLLVYTPPAFQASDALPCIFYLPGFGSHPLKWMKKDFPMFRLLDYLILSGELPPVLMACVDGSTKLGGSQYVNSELHGDFESHIIDEVIPLVENKFGARGPHFIAGHSSGGMGALHLASLYPHVFQGIASFGGDMYFELTHKNMIANLINDIQQGKLGISMNQCLAQGITNYPLALSAAYSPRPEYKKWKVDFPFDEQKLTIREDIWERWLSFDPLCWSDERCLKLKGCQSVILSAGDQDNFNLHLGAEALSNKLKDLGVPVIHQRVKGDHSLSVSQAEVGLRALLSGGSRHQGRSSSSKR